MKKLKFNIYKLLIFIGILGSSLSISSLIVAAFPAFDKFAVFSTIVFPAIGGWANLEAGFSKKSEDYKNLESQMEAQDKIHSIILTKLEGQCEYLNLRIDQVVEFESLKSSAAANSEEIRKIKRFLARKGFKEREQSTQISMLRKRSDRRPNRKVRHF